MPAVPSSATDTGSPAAAFSLPEPATGATISLADYQSQRLFIIFMCNHCPYVIHILDSLVEVTSELKAMGIETVAISANDATSYPADSPEKMAELAAAYRFAFPYLYDETQQTARAYDAQCTPDLYLYNEQHKLYYRGQYDSSRPGSSELPSGSDLLAAARALLAGDSPPENQTPSVGCSIKWKS